VQNTPRRLAGLVSYDNGNGGYTEKSGETVDDGWQDYGGDMISDSNPNLQRPHTDGNGLYTQFDGIVVVGAHDFPVPFEITNVQPDSGGCGNAKVTIPGGPNGMHRLANPNPFDTASSPPKVLTNSTLEPEFETAIEGKTPNRVLRIMDHQGDFQFSRICDATYDTGSDTLTLELLDRPYFRENSERYGLEPCSQQTGDVTYRAALLDAFWLRVRQDPTEVRNHQLVRNRLDAGALVASLSDVGQAEFDWAGLNPGSVAVDLQNPAVIADRVVDFQLWFDCADDTGTRGAIEGADWKQAWRTPVGEGAPGTASEEPTNCLNPDDPDPARARVAHVRLSMRTSGERPSLAHVPFQAGGQRMQTYDLYPGAKGASRVLTLQTEFELPTFSARNLVDTSSP
ncbi:MAG: hypothetical protein ABEN55_12260, partial [Bradymonadaceae bacterium]